MRPRDNPFRIERLRALSYELPAGETWEGLLARLDALTAGSGVAVLLGPEGRGKSTLMREIAARLEECGEGVRWAHLRRGERCLGAARRRALELPPTGGWWCVDGVEQLPRWRRLRLRRRAAALGARLLVTAHARPGSARRWPVLATCEASPRLLGHLMARLAPDGPPLPSADELFGRHDGNLALALLEAYDRAAAV